MVFMQF